MEKSSRKAGLDRREALRRMVAGAGAAGAAAALPVPARPAVAATEAQGPTEAQAAPFGAAGPGMSLGAAEPPDPSLTAPDWKPRFFDDHQSETVLAVGDLLIPATDTPGMLAKTLAQPLV